MLIRNRPDLADNDVTDQAIYRRRRDFMKLGATALIGASGLPLSACSADSSAMPDDQPTPLDDITSYNNFVELGTSKSSPSRNAGRLVTRPWSVTVDGECEKPGVLDFEDILKSQTLEERIYRLRCVEGWSMVIPWMGFQLSTFLQAFKPTSKAQYVRFQTLLDPEQMPGQKRPILGWPYTEGLRMDEAMHPLTFIATGLYGEELPAQNGAPLRLVVPWKYGFKSIKSIVRISFVEEQPLNTWQETAPDEYGFYANVNPDVSHPRWSQRKERRIGEFRKRKTLFLNGYADQVAQLYKGMDLRKNF